MALDPCASNTQDQPILLPHGRTFRLRRISIPSVRRPDRRWSRKINPSNLTDGTIGVGVGDASASPTAALLLSVLQESMGRIATILFAHRLGTSLEPECKMYRLAADVFNDTAMVLDCLSPAFPKTTRVLILSFSSVLRSLCGVCAGSSKASLSAHFAKRGNLGELNAVCRCCGSVEVMDGVMSIWILDHFIYPLLRVVQHDKPSADRFTEGL